ncbi:hypothetical protein [Spirosoma flavum]|uniref:Uncharacterized protein n=1 Tax=Spirosoma flavum TaxID=2048557 RepID=A0ABW6AUS2_9BACT
MKNTLFPPKYLYLSALLVLLPSCHHGLDPDALYFSTFGYWEWVSTSTPSGVLTPKSEGYTQQMQRIVDDNPKGTYALNYFAFYKNDTLQHRYKEVENQTYIADVVRNTVIVNYDTLGYLKWYIIPNSRLIKFSQVRNPYSLAPDTIVSTYTTDPYLKAKLYPY